MRGDEYRLVTSRVRRRTQSAVSIDKPASRGGGSVWIPLSVIHAADEIKLLAAGIGEEVTFRLREWKADECGFAE